MNTVTTMRTPIGELTLTASDTALTGAVRRAGPEFLGLVRGR